jgi:hypothetical protein
VSVIARDESRLNALADGARNLPGRVTQLPVDYQTDDALRAAIERAANSVGPISLVIAWIHSTAPRAVEIVGRTVAAGGHPVRMLHVLGSAAADPTLIAPPRSEWISDTPNPAYQRVILGYIIECDGESRWLSDDEICAGVLAAIEHEQRESVVGVIEPWDRRPR